MIGPSIDRMKFYLHLALTLGFFNAATAVGAEPRNVDFKDPEAIKKEFARINEGYKNDIPKLIEEGNRFAREVSYATGHGEQFDQRQRLLKKYGPLATSMEILPGNGSPGKIVDFTAWTISTRKEGARTVVSFALDQSRYAGAAPTQVRVQLRRKGATPEEEAKLARGVDAADSFRVFLAVVPAGDGKFATALTVPVTEAGPYVLQISADIEPGWGVEAVFPLVIPVP